MSLLLDAKRTFARRIFEIFPFLRDATGDRARSALRCLGRSAIRPEATESKSKECRRMSAFVGKAKVQRTTYDVFGVKQTTRELISISAYEALETSQMR
jgi:hypothetical protein